MADGFDRRLTPAREDLAAAHLAGTVTADRFVEPQPMQIVADQAPMLAVPDPATGFDTEFLRGEAIDIYDIRDGWAWGQSVVDGYVGYVASAALGPRATATHRIAILGAPLYRQPALKSASGLPLSFGAHVMVEETSGGYARIGPTEWVAKDHLTPLDQPADDWVAVAEMFLHLPYIWGGRSSRGLDCSALIQLSRQACNLQAPRDTDMQERELGVTLPPATPRLRGDLIFWRGHVGVMLDAETLLHATAYTMRVLKEPLARAIARIKTSEFGAITRHARLDPGR